MLSGFSQLEKSVMQTLAWFDIFEYPLTLVELKKYLWDFDREISLVEIQNVLDKLENFKNFQGFYFLKNRENSIVENRLRKYNISETKFKKRAWVFKIIALIPFVRLVGICNTMAYRGAKAESDIDLFVITEKNRLWWTRFLILSFLSVFRLRPQKNNFQNKICLSFFVDTTKLNLAELKKGEDDIYFYFWLAHLWPVYNENIYHDFWQENSWLKAKLKFVAPQELNSHYKIKLAVIVQLLKRWFEGIINLLAGGWTENFLMNFQLNKIPSAISDKMNLGSEVVINEHLFKAHTGDRRGEYQKIFEDKLK
ncbi:MAG: hypothetical protein WCX88_01605 [Patescibacteria group bacterium]